MANISDQKTRAQAVAAVLAVVVANVGVLGWHWHPWWLVCPAEALCVLLLAHAAAGWRRRRDRAAPRRSLEDLEAFTLGPCPLGPRQGDVVTVLEAVALYAGEGRTGAPRCVSPVTARWVEMIGQHGPPWAQDELRPLVPAMATTVLQGSEQERLATLRRVVKELGQLVPPEPGAPVPSTSPTAAQLLGLEPAGASWLALMEAVVASEALSPAKQRCFWHIVLGATAELVAGRAPHEHVA